MLGLIFLRQTYQVEVRIDDPNAYSKVTHHIRYNSFYSVNDQLIKELPDVLGNYDFPPKKVLTRFADNVIEYRRRELEKWLQFCFEQNKVLQHPVFQQFLKITVRKELFKFFLHFLTNGLIQHLKDQIEAFIANRATMIDDNDDVDDDSEVFNSPPAPASAAPGTAQIDGAPPMLDEPPTVHTSISRATKPAASSRRQLAPVGEKPESLILPDGFDLSVPTGASSSTRPQLNDARPRSSAMLRAPPNSLSRGDTPANSIAREPPAPAETGEKMTALYAYDDGKIKFKVRYLIQHFVLIVLMSIVGWRYGQYYQKECRQFLLVGGLVERSVW